MKFEKDKLEKTLKKRHLQLENELKESSEHLRIQFLLTEIGRSLGYDVFIAVDDRTKSLDGKSLEFIFSNLYDNCDSLCRFGDNNVLLTSFFSI